MPTDPWTTRQGPNSVWNQHRKYFNEVNDPRNPRAAFLEDFDAALTSWIATGDQVLVSGDFNDDISSRKIQNLFAKHGMHHMVFCRHNQADAPATCNKNTTTHKNVDGVWGTANLVPLKCGFLEAGDFPGDHVMIWMDIAYEDALGHNPPPVHRPEARRLKLDDVRVEKRYMTEYRKRIEKSNLSARQFALEDVIKLAKELTTAQAKEANDIDDKRFCAMMQANHRCRKLLMGAVHFSASTQLPRNEIAFWTYAIARRKHRLLKGKELDTDKYGSRKWARAKHAAKVTKVTKSMTIDDMQLELDEAFKRYNTAKKNHEDSRIAFIKTFPEEQQKRILRAEEQRRKGRICRRINQKLAGGSVTHVIVTDPDGSQRTCNDKDSIEAACLETHENKYRQTEDSPFMQDPLLRDFGYQDAYYHAEEILLGIYDIPDGVSIHTRRMIAEMKMPPEILEYDPCPDFVSDHSHTSAWRKAKERTSAGISGLHFGMFKAQAKDPECASLDASMRSVAYRTGHVYPRWKKGVDVVLLKRQLDFRVEKLRTILLLEADANMNYKQLGRDGMWNGLRSGVAAKEDYGGKKNHRAIEVSLNQRFTGDILRQKRKAAIICSTDAKGCFDRIVHIVAYIALRRFGVARQPILGMIKAIQEMTHHIRTAFGDSTTTYGNDPNQPPLQGMLQGNGASGTAWAAVSTLIVNVMRTAGFGFSTWSAISKEAVDMVCYQFVDDATLLFIQASPTSPPAKNSMPKCRKLLPPGKVQSRPLEEMLPVEMTRATGTWWTSFFGMIPGTIVPSTMCPVPSSSTTGTAPPTPSSDWK